MPVMKPSELIAARRDKILAIAAAHGASNVRVFGKIAPCIRCPSPMT